MKIFIDAGHGGTNPGAVSATGLREADVNLEVALDLGKILTSWGYDVNYSRTDNITVSLAERAKLANEWGADYFVSIHCNSNENPIYGGTETFYYRKGIRAEVLAKTVNNALVRQIGLKDLGTATANFAVLRLTRMPAILVELAFLSNPTEAQLLGTVSFRKNCAIGIANGISEYTNQ
ncbi:MAG: N-acetylmuramoyl-L-alanine amidase [Firmicutes bacterium]|nr:N-acetylmuramoyl-L-alanine amidase [Bacillota bacterium]